MTEREAFEQWAVTEDFSVARDQWERYASMATQHALAGWQASRKQALEEAAKVCDSLRDDAKEVEALAKFNAAQASGNTRNELDRGEFWLTVSTFNAGLRRAAIAIRSLTTPTKGTP